MSPGANLAISLGLVIAGHAAAQRLERREGLRSFLDGLVLVTVGGLCALFILPHAFEVLGSGSLLLAAVGFFLPLVSERFLQRHEGESKLMLVAALGALALHSGLDGAALAGGGHEHHGHEHAVEGGALALAVLAHRLPVGLFLGSTVRSLAGKGWAIAGTSVVVAATIGGFFLHEGLEPYAETRATGVLNALLAGGLFHVVVGHGGDSPSHLPASRRNAALGALLGVGILLLAPIELPAPLVQSGRLAYHLFCESAPAILLGFLGAGLLSLVPQHRLAALMTGKTTLGSAIRGVVFGLPIPICSCGVVPLYRGLMNRGVPAAAAVAFLIATPELGLDSIFLSIPLLGWKITLARFGAAVVLALTAGVAVAWLTRKDPAPAAPDAAPPPEEPGGAKRVWGTFVESLDELGPWMIAGIAVAAAVDPFLSQSSLEGLPPSAQVPLFAAISAPIYVCAASATPVASVLLFKGVSLGAVIAFLLTGPATNVTTYGALRASHGRKTTLLLIAIVLATTVAIGVVLNQAPLTPPKLPGADGEHPHVVQNLAALAFVAFLLYSLFRQGPRGFLSRLGIRHTHAEHGHQDGHDHGHSHDHGQGPGCHDACHEEAQGGHDHDGHDHDGRDHDGRDHGGHDHGGHDHGGHDHGGHDHGGHDHAQDEEPKAPAAPAGDCCGGGC